MVEGEATHKRSVVLECRVEGFACLVVDVVALFVGTLDDVKLGVNQLFVVQFGVVCFVQDNFACNLGKAVDTVCVCAACRIGRHQEEGHVVGFAVNDKLGNICVTVVVDVVSCRGQRAVAKHKRSVAVATLDVVECACQRVVDVVAVRFAYNTQNTVEVRKHGRRIGTEVGQVVQVHVVVRRQTDLEVGCYKGERLFVVVDCNVEVTCEVVSFAAVDKSAYRVCKVNVGVAFVVVAKTDVVLGRLAFFFALCGSRSNGCFHGKCCAAVGLELHRVAVFAVGKCDVLSVEVSVGAFVAVCAVDNLTYGGCSRFVDLDFDLANNVAVAVGAFFVNVVGSLVCLGITVRIDDVVHGFGVVDEYRTRCVEHYRSKVRGVEGHACTRIHDLATVDCVQCRKGGATVDEVEQVVVDTEVVTVVTHAVGVESCSVTCVVQHQYRQILLVDV